MVNNCLAGCRFRPARFDSLIEEQNAIHAADLSERTERASEEERQKCYVESAQYAQQLSARGQYLLASPLHPTSTATSVRVRDVKRLVTDGPFAETREQLGGFYLVEAKNLDEAINIAGGIPAGRWGTVEVRPVMEISGLPEHSATRQVNELAEVKK